VNIPQTDVAQTGVAQNYIPSLVSWNLTRLCNLKCPHCYLDAGPAKRGARLRRDELTTGECLAVLGEMVELGTEMVILTGGEPLLRKDIYQIARTASERGLWVVMGTNGVLVNDRVAKKMVECGIRGVGISIDSTDPERHDAFRGGPDSWRHSMKALEVCREHGLQVLVQTTVMAENRDEVPAMLDMARDLGAWSFNLYFLVRTGRACDTRQDGPEMHELDAAATEELLGDLVSYQEEYKPMLVRSKCAPHFKRIAYEKGLAGLESGGCMAGTQYCRITPEGDVTPCPYMDAVAGNVRDRGFAAVWRGSQVLGELRDLEQLKGRCGACEYKELCGGCRCRAYAATGDYLTEDPACLHEPRGKVLDEEAPVTWSDEARSRLERIPISFIRNKVRSGMESYARRQGVPVITGEIMQQGLQGDGRPAFEGMPATVRETMGAKKIRPPTA
jgi:radical SAM protein with 4Fe4S-binding SPASM domain